MATNRTECFRFELGTVNRFLVAEKYKLWEIYWMCDAYGGACLSQKNMFTNKLNMGLLQRTWIKGAAQGVEAHLFSGK